MTSGIKQSLEYVPVSIFDGKDTVLLVRRICEHAEECERRNQLKLPHLKRRRCTWNGAELTSECMLIDLNTQV